jgi:hypothetical protein
VPHFVAIAAINDEDSFWRNHMKIGKTVAMVFTIALTRGFSQTAGGAAGTGPYAAPSAAAYAIIDNAAYKIVKDNNLKDQPVVLYDAQFFSLISPYQTALLHLRKTMKDICPATGGAHAFALVPTLDIGGAASGLAALLTALTPSYSVQGQALTFDNSALVAAFAKEAGAGVVFPGYLLPSAKTRDVLCGQEDQANSLADLWYAAAAQASKLRSDIAQITGTTPADVASKKDLQDKLDAYTKVAETYLAIDKGTSLLAKLLVVETLAGMVPDAGVAVIDLKLDAVGMESVTRTWVGTKKTNFACSVLAHYTLLRLGRSGGTLTLKPSTTDMLNILTKVPNEDKFGTSVTPRGVINGNNSQ